MSDELPVPAPSAPIVEAKPKKKSRKDAAVAVFEDAANGIIGRESVETSVAKTRRGLRGSASFSAVSLIEIANDKKVPPGTRVKAIALHLQGSGAMQSGAPITEAERRALDAENDRMEQMTAAELEQKVRRMADLAVVPEGD